MRRARFAQAGFTIVEVMIFLAITGVLLASALLLFNGRIARTQFTQGVHELDNKIKGVVTEVAAGTYPGTQPFDCTVDTSGQIRVTLNAGGEQGTRNSCIFLGKVMQFGVNGANGCSGSNLQDCRTLNIYTAAGRRLASGGKDVQSLAGPDGARPELIDGSEVPGSEVNLTETVQLGGGMWATKLVQVSNNNPVGAIGIFQTLGSYSTGVNPRLNPGSQTVQTWPIAAGAFPQTQSTVHDSVANHNPDGTFAPANANPTDGIMLCVEGGVNQKASIVVGGMGGKVTTSITFEDVRC